MKTIKIGLIGLGTIGSGVAEYLFKNSSELKKKSGIHFSLAKIAEKDRAKIPSRYKDIIVPDVDAILSDSEIDIVIELIGGIHPAKEYILKALRNGKYVITANKALLAEEGDVLFREANRRNVRLLYEASVCAGIPLVHSLEESLIANEIDSILGIVNGTSNYILTIMEEENISMKRALKIAQDKGYAEKNPLLDLEGIDSAHKLALLLKLAFRINPKFSQIYKEGITRISHLDIKYASDLGYRIKLLAIAKRKSSNFIEARVHPTLLPLNHMLSSVKGVFNAVYIKGNFVGEMVFYGKGAGKLPTTSAIISDLIDSVKNLKDREFVSPQYLDSKIKGLMKIKNIRSRYYIRFMALDKPGVLAKISGILGNYNISISSVSQKERRKVKSVPIVMMTHEANEKNMRDALKTIEKFKTITQKPVYIRVEE